MESKPAGLKTVERLTDFPFVNSAFANASDYYGRIKERNMLTRASCNLAELSFKTMLFAATPVTSLCKKPSKPDKWRKCLVLLRFLTVFRLF